MILTSLPLAASEYSTLLYGAPCEYLLESALLDYRVIYCKHVCNTVVNTLATKSRSPPPPSSLEGVPWQNLVGSREGVGVSHPLASQVLERADATRLWRAAAVERQDVVAAAAWRTEWCNSLARSAPSLTGCHSAGYG